MKGEENHFRKGLFISLGLHLLVVCLLALGVGGHGQVSPERSIEVSLSTQVPRADKKKSSVKAPSRSPKPEKNVKNVKKKISKPSKEKPKTPQKKKPGPDAVAAKKKESPEASPAKTKAEKPKEPAAPPKETAQNTESKTKKEEVAAKRDPLESGKREVIRDIKKESVLSSIKKTAAQASAELASKETGPGLISLVLDVYYRTISKRIQKNLILPLNIDSGILLNAQVNFHMRESGEVYDVGIERSSGNTQFDSYCIKAVNSASPLPPPPNELRDRIKSEFFIISCESKK